MAATTTDKWIEELKGISVLELSERIKALEEAFGVTSARGRGGEHHVDRAALLLGRGRW